MSTKWANPFGLRRFPMSILEPKEGPQKLTTEFVLFKDGHMSSVRMYHCAVALYEKLDRAIATVRVKSGFGDIFLIF